jgi:hypothetical protein
VCRSGAAEDVAHFLLDCAPLQPGRAPLLRLFDEARRDHPSLFPAEVLPREELILISLGKRPASDTGASLPTSWTRALCVQSTICLLSDGASWRRPLAHSCGPLTNG